MKAKNIITNYQKQSVCVLYKKVPQNPQNKLRPVLVLSYKKPQHSHPTNANLVSQL